MQRILLAGFGGQGILFAGKFLAYMGLHDEKEVSWLPSYGPEMRGGTANCSVILAEENIGSPIVSTPDILICMNLPSMDKFEPAMEKGGLLLYDSSLITRQPEREDIKGFGIPATQMASDHEMPTLANVIMLGKTARETGLCDLSTAEGVMRKIVPEKKQKLLGANLKALALGYEYQ
ncbi:2-oxoacid:acceptor oxidoreductase family protein [Ruminococcaceae bacterium OttesenSCG-928-I18]|nr:2-oxoacid:acceptor oxidoreductase family protein [Ruminococcaceae bacterium OttesenSCG-928-I18]